MSKVRKSLCLLLVVMLVAVSLVAIQPSYAQSIPKPSVPEFTAKYVDHSYTVPARTHIDPYTGEQLTDPSYVVENKTIELAIDNRPYASSPQSDSQRLFYNVREKGSFIKNWTDIYTANSGFVRPSNSDYTIVSYRLSDSPFSGELTNGGQVDFQVQAMVGGIYRIDSHFSSGDEFIGVTSEWSSTQTVTIPSSDSSPAPSPTVPELSWLAFLPLCFLGFFVALLFKRKRLS